MTGKTGLGSTVPAAEGSCRGLRVYSASTQPLEQIVSKLQFENKCLRGRVDEAEATLQSIERRGRSLRRTRSSAQVPQLAADPTATRCD